MTYLQQALDKQRTARLPEEDFTLCDDGQAAALTVYTSPSEVWAFPWGSLVSARFDQIEKREQIVLTFPHHRIVICGRNLDRLMAAIGVLRLASVRVRLDGAQAQYVAMDKTVITEITVSAPDAMLAMDSTA